MRLSEQKTAVTGGDTVDAAKANSADLLSLRVELASSNCDLMASHPDHQ